MVRNQLRWLLPVVALTATLAAHSQPTGRVANPDPSDPRAITPPMVHESSFAHYRKFSEEKPIAWREANDTVGRIGGWRTYAREARQPEPATAPASAPNASSAAEPAKPATMPAGQGGHKMN